MATVGLAQRRAPSPKPTYLMPRARLQHLSNASQASAERSFCSWKKILAVLLIAFIVWQAYFPSSRILPVKDYIQKQREAFASNGDSAPADTASHVEKGYLIVGVQSEPEFSRTVAFSWRLKDSNPNLESRALAFPSTENFTEWVRKSTAENVIPSQFNTVEHPVVVFKDGKFLGGSAAIRSDAYASGLTMPSASGSSNAQATTETSQVASKPTTKSPVAQSVLRQVVTNRQVSPQEPIVPAAASQIQKPASASMVYLPAQVTFKNKIITGYRSSESKSFTNYKPFASVLTADEGWQFLYQAPLMASIILVQDQTSASNAMIRYPKAMINNIGWGGQSCLGGTKGAQIKCRSDKAEKDGCSYESLKIQPPQNRLWIPSECKDFFENKCRDADEQMFIQKPSGGQHGFGMKVHKGCGVLKEEFASFCSGEGSDAGTNAVAAESVYPASKKKYFIMPYLQPALLDGHKFDVRTYGLIASLSPLLAFYADGFVRRATTRYSTENLHDETAHITNSVKQNSNDDHFWDFARLSKYLHEKHSFPPEFMSRGFRQRAMKVTEFVFQSARQWMKQRSGRFQLFACDWIVDSSGGIHLLEVNSNPLVGATPYPGLEHHFPAIWKELMDLVISVQTGGMLTSRLKKFEYCHRKYWWLCLNELEETEPYNSCKVFQAEPNPPADLFTAPHVQPHKSLEEIQRDVDNEGRDEMAIEREENVEQAEANGDEETARAPEGPHPVKPVPFVDLHLESAGREDRVIPCPGMTTIDEHRRRCSLAMGTEDESVYHIINSDVPGPIVVVVAGVHGNEGAGVVAARHVAKHWKVQKGTLVVLERANARGVAGNLRFVPASHDGVGFYDLNRAFPMDESSSPRVLVSAIWNLMADMKPDLFFDLHEGRTFFAASSQAAAAQHSGAPSSDPVGAPPSVAAGSPMPILENVGSTTGGKVSKGNSIVTSLNAEELARVIAEACNENVDNVGRKFLIMAPPITGGLASKVQASFNSKVMLFETTLVFPLETRARQHLFMLSVALRAVGVLPADFDFSQVGGPVEPCVATRKGCLVEL